LPLRFQQISAYHRDLCSCCRTS